VDDFEVLSVEDFAGVKASRVHRKRETPVTELEPFEPLSKAEMMEALIVHRQAETKRKSTYRAPLMDTRQVVFIDGEGSNRGDPELRIHKGLRRSIQQQNYSLLTAVYEDEHADRIIGANNCEQLSTIECLEFILGLPADHTLISFGFTYDVEMILRDLGASRDPNSAMHRLITKKKVYWGNYAILYIPHKLFYIRRMNRKRNRNLKSERGKGDSRRIFDIAGFFGNVGFKTVTEKWQVATPEEQQFLERMKLARPEFGPITQETLDYNLLEGKLGIRVFKKIRSEWIGLGLKVTSPHGAGSLASAMYAKNQLDSFMELQQVVPSNPFLRGYIGGRFDYSRQEEFPIAYEADINSAYPHIMRGLYCLTHCRIEWTNQYIPDQHSLWLCRWTPTNQRWALFPYRSGKKIRYHKNGIGWYYGAEVAAALRLDPSLEILEGYRFIPECDHKPFGWIEEYYYRRQELKSTQPFTAEVLKIGMNSGYGKLAQTKGHVPKYQNLIWAGMITSGTRAMLLDAIYQSPENVIAVSTDSVTSTIPLNLDYDEIRLGAWKQKRLENYLLLGNGFAYSTTRDSKGNLLKDTHRGFLDSEWDWDKAKQEWLETGHITAWRMEFNNARESWIQKDPSLRCTWSKFQSRLPMDLPERRWKAEDGWIYPSTNLTPNTLSAELSVTEQNLRMSQFGTGVFVPDWEEDEKLNELVEEMAV